MDKKIYIPKEKMFDRVADLYPEHDVRESEEMVWSEDGYGFLCMSCGARNVAVLDKLYLEMRLSQMPDGTWATIQSKSPPGVEAYWDYHTDDSLSDNLSGELSDEIERYLMNMRGGYLLCPQCDYYAVTLNPLYAPHEGDDPPVVCGGCPMCEGHFTKKEVREICVMAAYDERCVPGKSCEACVNNFARNRYNIKTEEVADLAERIRNAIHY